MATWVELVNNGRNIETFVTQQDILDHLYDHDIDQLNWMKIFNSKIELTTCFITRFAHLIQWQWLIRPLPEAILERYHKHIIQWNVHLYGKPLTYDFLMNYQDRFNWTALSSNPPKWFTDIHYNAFGSKMDWKKLTKHCKNIHSRLIERFAGNIDWEWVSEHDIRGERFAIIHLYDINWDHPRLDVSHLSTEFLYNLYEVRRLAYKMMYWPSSPLITSKKNRLMPFLSADLVKDYNPNDPPRLGATIGLRFAFDHRNVYDWKTLCRKGLINRDTLSRFKLLERKVSDLAAKKSEISLESPPAPIVDDPAS